MYFALQTFQYAYFLNSTVQNNYINKRMLKLVNLNRMLWKKISLFASLISNIYNVFTDILENVWF